MSVSFGFKRKVETKVIPQNDKNKATDEPEFLHSIDGKVIQSSRPKEEKKELIIPLIKQNKWKIPQKPPVKDVDKDEDSTIDTADQDLADSAAKELIEESNAFLNKPSDDQDDFDKMAVPLLMKNKVPEGFEEDDKLDVSLRPDEASDADYNTVPVEAYGMAVLRGMGWNPNEGIGRTFKKNIKVYEQNVRPKGLGLGASVPNVNKNDKGKGKANGNINKDSETLELKQGSYVVAVGGSHKDKYGVVQGIDVEEGRCMVKMAIGGKTQVISEYSLKPVSKKEYEKNAKDISRLSKAYTEGRLEAIMSKDKRDYKRSEEKPPEVQKKHKHDNYSDKEDDHRTKSKKSKKNYDSDGRSKRKKDKKRTHEYENENAGHHKKKKRQASPRKPKYWVKRHMRVRVVDSKYKKGRYFKQKVTVEDILGGGVCCCKTDDGKLLDDLKESMLETVIPRSDSDSYVIIVKSGSSNDGKLAKVLRKNKESATSIVQLIEDRDVVLELTFEQICEFVGDAEAHDMF